VIRFDDLVAARLLSQQRPDCRDVLVAALETLHDAPAAKGLLESLVACSVLKREEASQVWRGVEAYKRARLVSFYARHLTGQGIEDTLVRDALARLGPDHEMDALGEVLVRSGRLARPQEQQLRHQARSLAGNDESQQLQAYLASRGNAAPTLATLGESGVRRAPAPALPPLGDSDVHHTPDSRRFAAAAAAPPRPAEAVPIAAPLPGVPVPAARPAKPTFASSADDEPPKAPPRFKVPAWIDTNDASVGQAIRQYRILGKIGAGAMGIVYLGDCAQEPDRAVAIKVLNGNATSEAKGRFKREILANSMFSHPGVIDVYDAGRTGDGRDFLVMEFFEGEDLEHLVEREKQLPPRQALRLCRQVFEILGAAHAAGLVHRDVKPANILVSRDGETAKLMDFGIAIIKDLGEFENMVFRTVEGGSTGTPAFMSPEQAAEDLVLGPSDLYSMGLVLYQTLSGRLPFESETPHGFVTCHMMEEPLPLAKAAPGLGGLPKELHALLGRLFDKNPANRPPAEEILSTIDRVLPIVPETKAGTGLLRRLFGR
jgi:hypothetical protein